MLSLNKAYSHAELSYWLEWASNYDGMVVASPKVDGMAIALRYDDTGRLYEAVSRSGMDYTASVMRIPGIPSRIFYPCEVRGEIYMPLLAAHGRRPREAASAAVRACSETCKELRFVAYDLDGVPGMWRDRMTACRLMGFETVPTWTVVDEPEGVIARVCAYSRPYDIDGIVFRLDDVSEFERAGSTRYAPHGAIAFKLYD